jgi:hypothetical protein
MILLNKIFTHAALGPLPLQLSRRETTCHFQAKLLSLYHLASSGAVWGSESVGQERRKKKYISTSEDGLGPQGRMSKYFIEQNHR